MIKKINKENLCISCFDQISSPLCSECKMRELSYKLFDYGFAQIEIESILVQIDGALPTETENRISCVICSKNKVSLCSKCFSDLTRHVIRKHCIKNINFLFEFQEEVEVSEFWREQ